MPSMSFGTSFTVAFWHNPQLRNYGAFGRDWRWIFYTHANGDFSTAIGNGSSWDENTRKYAGAGTLQSGNWYLFVMTYGNGTLKSYVNDTEKLAATSSVSVPNCEWYLGWDNVNAQYYAQGLIDEVIVWNTALSAAEIASLYANGSPTRSLYSY